MTEVGRRLSALAAPAVASALQFTINLAGVKGVAVLPPTGARYQDPRLDVRGLERDEV